MAKNQNKKVEEEKVYSDLSTEMKRQYKAGMPESLSPLDGEIKIMLPVPFLTMEFKEYIDPETGKKKGFTSLHLDVMREMFYHIREVLIKQLDPTYQGYNSLFKASDFSKNGKDLFIPMKLKDFHVSPAHYKQLRSALEILPIIPVAIPFEDGQKRKYRRITHLCDVYIPEESETKIRNYVNITIEEEVAKRLITMKFGFGEAGRKASQNLSSKYSKRIYDLLSTYKNLGGYTISTMEFKRMCGIANKYKNRWNKVEENILLLSKKEIDDHFSKGECDLSFTYRPLYHGGKNVGEPDAIEFKIFSASSELDRKIIIIEKGYTEQFEKFLKEEFNLSPSLCKMFLKRVTGENVKSALSTAVNIKAALESGNVKQSQHYIITSLNNFFENFVPPVEENKDMPPMKKWQQITETVGKGSDAAVSQVISRLLFVSFDEGINTLYLQAPSPEFAKKEVAPHESILIGKVHEYFGKEVNIKFTYKED
ncbi:MAG: replication initiation protein [Prevotella sp.]|nr:replication initiation protein [Prevotella sp.]